jgi:hypothetical protein
VSLAQADLSFRVRSAREEMLHREHSTMFARISTLFHSRDAFLGSRFDPPGANL